MHRGWINYYKYLYKVLLSITMVPLISVLLSALLICAVVQGASLSKSGVMHKSSVEPERDDHDILQSTYNTGRQLLPLPPHEHDNHAHPHPPHPPSHLNNKDSKYTGCLGLSDEELASFPDTPPCTISVNGIVVAGNEGSTTEESGSSISSGSDTSGSESGGSSESNSNGGNNNDSSTSGGVEDDRENKNEDDSDESSGGYYSYEVDESNGVGDFDDNTSSSSGIGGDDSNETISSSGRGGDDSSETNNSTESGGDEASNEGTDDSTNDGDDDDDVPSPLMYFNISDCETYANMWVWDLAMTCSDSSMNQTDCKCTSAEILMQYGELYCPSTEDPVCPDNCSVCHTCMELLGCSSPDDAQDGQYLSPEQVLLGDGMSSTILPLALGIAAAILGLVGSSYYQYTHRNMDTGAFPSLELEPPSNESML